MIAGRPFGGTMLQGVHIGLRARHSDDVAVLQSELYDDVATRSRADSRPWRPIPPDSTASPYTPTDPAKDVAPFSVVELVSQELAGEALLWGIDSHNRVAHIGIALRPSFRGRGFSADVIGVLCSYGFATLGLHRLQLETLADNEPMIRAAIRSGFLVEGTLRRSAWTTGVFSDEVILGLLVDDWKPTS
jgi:RimJ/RimL family protein N-acetyltransferase